VILIVDVQEMKGHKSGHKSFFKLYDLQSFITGDINLLSLYIRSYCVKTSVARNVITILFKCTFCESTVMIICYFRVTLQYYIQKV